jgi:hypothetical protein
MLPTMVTNNYQTFYEKMGGDEALSKLIKLHLQKILVFREFRCNYIRYLIQVKNCMISKASKYDSRHS